MDNKLIFALDIGTRSVIGLAGCMNGELFELKCVKSALHTKRAMIDGQIEDIKQVAKVAQQVKTEIEHELGSTLTNVSVAAAGRALRTFTAENEIQLPAGKAVSAQIVYELESGAINKAREALELENNSQPYYCVGHSVSRYYVDDYPFAKILGHKGSSAKVEVIATFLPTEVVNSLQSCMEILNLDIDTLTLEPIAAMRAVIPEDVRLLNLALVDIGAGTSDIAISKDGTIAGYTMATVAGDEISEAIIKKYLVDFKTAEDIKFELNRCFAQGGNEDEEIAFTDILGFSHAHTASLIYENVQSSVESLATVIADKISECNSGAPSAVFLVGGGSNTPGLCPLIANKLGLTPDKVAIAGSNFSSKLADNNTSLNAPEYATPLGIALTAADGSENESGAITINDKRVRLYSTQITNVMDALMIGGWRYSDLIGRSGKQLSFVLNGEKKSVRGQISVPAEISVNGKPSALTSPVKSGDNIILVPAQSGEDAKALVSDYCPEQKTLNVNLNGKWYTAGHYALINGNPASCETEIHDFDEVAVYQISNVAELLNAAGYNCESCRFTLNDKKCSSEQLLEEGDRVVAIKEELEEDVAAHVPEQNVVEHEPALEQITAMAEAVAEDEAAEHEPALEQSTAVAEAVAEDEAAEHEPAFESKPAEKEPFYAQNLEQAPAAAEKAEDVQPVRVEHVNPPLKSVDDDLSATGTVSVFPQPPVQEEQAQPQHAGHSEKTEDISAEVSGTVENGNDAVAEKVAEKPAASVQEEQKTDNAKTSAFAGGSLHIRLNDKSVVLPPKAGGAYLLYDLLTIVDVDLENPRGILVTRINSKDCAYTDAVKSGDEVCISWSEDL